MKVLEFTMPDRSIFQRLYESEINFVISCFSDDGFHVQLGDELNGFVAEHTMDTWDKVEQWLRNAALLHYPNSRFAKEEPIQT
jgi:hypothetical protein